MQQGFIARIRIVVDVPFDADVRVDESPETLADPVRAESARGITEGDRIAAAVHAETELVARVKAALADHGNVVAELVEEVRER